MPPGECPVQPEERDMSGLSRADHGVNPPAIEIPRKYNAAHDLIERNLAAGRAAKIAYIDDAGRCTYGELAERVNRAANALTELGLGMDDRLMLCHLDTIDWLAVFLGAIKAGIVPIAVNTLLTSSDYEFMLNDSRAKALVVSGELLAAVRADPRSLPAREARGRLGRERAGPAAPAGSARASGEPRSTRRRRAATTPASGSTRRARPGTPKGTVHVQTSMLYTAELYGRPVLGIRKDDVVFSAAKLFFAYGLGNSLTFPLAVGATTVLMAERPTPACGVQAPQGASARRSSTACRRSTRAMLASAESAADAASWRLRVCVSAGEALPGRARPALDRALRRSRSSTASARPRCCTSSSRTGPARCATGPAARRCPATGSRVVDEHGEDGGPRRESAISWSRARPPRRATGTTASARRSTFLGEWTRTGDKYILDADGYYTYGGRSDDMLKVGGIFVSPFEVEAALLTHPDVLEAAVVGIPDDAQLDQAEGVRRDEARRAGLADARPTR